MRDDSKGCMLCDVCGAKLAFILIFGYIDETRLFGYSGNTLGVRRWGFGARSLSYLRKIDRAPSPEPPTPIVNIPNSWVIIFLLKPNWRFNF